MEAFLDEWYALAGFLSNTFALGVAGSVLILVTLYLMRRRREDGQTAQVTIFHSILRITLMLLFIPLFAVLFVVAIVFLAPVLFR